jgi:hypothetical protein
VVTRLWQLTALFWIVLRAPRHITPPCCPCARPALPWECRPHAVLEIFY